MTGDSKFFIGVIVAAVVVVGGIVLFSGDKKSTGDTVTIDTTVGAKLGPDDAKVKIVEFGDFQCPACQAAAADFHNLQKNNNDVQLIFRHFPLTGIHANAEASSVAAAAAANQGKFWEMYDRLYERQASWSTLADPTGTFEDYARELGLDVNVYNADVKADATIKAVRADYDYGLSLDVDSTPTFFINGQRVTGVKTADEWQKLIEDARK